MSPAPITPAVCALLITMLATGVSCAPKAASPERADTQPIAPGDPLPSQHETPAPDAPDELREVSPGVWLDAERGVVEFAARVSPMIIGGAHGRDRFLLEQFVCLAGTKDHESVVVTDAKPSVVHAALLAAGATPGAPVTWVDEADSVRIVPPSGTPVRVEFILSDSVPIDPRSWVVDAESGAPLAGGGWVFAGSTMKPSRGTMFYEADAAGTLIGLAGFGSEAIAWTSPISDQEEDGELRWIAAESSMPPGDTPVRVRITVMR